MAREINCDWEELEVPHRRGRVRAYPFLGGIRIQYLGPRGGNRGYLTLDDEELDATIEALGRARALRRGGDVPAQGGDATSELLGGGG